MGSLCAAGADTMLFTDPNTATGSVLPTAPTKIALARTVDLNLPFSGVPAGVGITGNTTWTLWWWGELYLQEGPHTFDLHGDDYAFLEIAEPDSTAFTKLIDVNNATEAANFTANQDGWYPVRVALVQNTGGVDLYPRLDGVTIPRTLTRCRVDQYRGLAATGFDESHFLDVATTSIIDTNAAFVDWGGGRPDRLGITENDTFSVRWAGQFFIAIDGTYRFRTNSDDGYRLWIDGAALADKVPDGVYNDTTNDLALTRGWHDLVFDTTESTGGALSSFVVAAGPELVGLPFPPERLRPVEGRAERFDSTTISNVANNTTPGFPVTAPLHATVTGVDVGFQAGAGANVTASLSNAASATNLQTGTVSAVEVLRFHPATFTNNPFTPAWSFGFTSTPPTTLPNAWLTVHYRDDDGRPTPTTASYQSSVRDLLAGQLRVAGDLLASGDTTVNGFGAVALTVRGAPGATVTIAVRTGDTETACASATWSSEFASSAIITGVAPHRYLQYRLSFTTDGDHEPAVERVEIAYYTM